MGNSSRLNYCGLCIRLLLQLIVYMYIKTYLKLFILRSKQGTITHTSHLSFFIPFKSKGRNGVISIQWIYLVPVESIQA